MEFINKSIAYILKAFAKNEEAENFVDDFFSAFVTWIRPIFLKDDPTAKTVLDMNGADDAKKKIISEKLSELLKDQSFKEELAGWLTKLEANSVDKKNILENTKLRAKGNVKIGDKEKSDTHSGDKNIVRGSDIEGSDFHLGDG